MAASLVFGSGIPQASAPPRKLGKARLPTTVLPRRAAIQKATPSHLDWVARRAARLAHPNARRPGPAVIRSEFQGFYALGRQAIVPVPAAYVRRTDHPKNGWGGAFAPRTECV